jgi:hypothetical protein
MQIYSHAFALEDLFFLYINDYKPGFVVDIGCGHPLTGSNSKSLSEKPAYNEAEPMSCFAWNA